MTQPTPVSADKEPSNLGLYAKQINATIILVLGVFVTAYVDGGGVTTTVWIMAVIALLRGALAFGVRPEWGKVGVYLPLILTAVIAALTQLITALADANGLTTGEILTVAVVFFTAIGSTQITSNARVSDKLRGYYSRAA